MNRQRMRSAQFWLMRTRKQLLFFWERAVQPSQSIEDPEILRRSRILNRILVVIIPTTLLVLLIQLGVYPVDLSQTSTTISSVMMGFAAAVLIYLVNRITKNFRLVSYL